MIDSLLDHIGLDHVVVNWFGDGNRKNSPVYFYAVVHYNITSFHELQRFVEKPHTIEQLTCIDPTDRLTYQVHRKHLLALPQIHKDIITPENLLSLSNNYYY